MRLLTVICVAALVFAFAVPAFAETQNIKVSGDIKVAYVYQQDVNQVVNADNQNFFMQQIGLNVEADLTDNVSTYLRVVNERGWETQRISAGAPGDMNIRLDEAYVTLKEMLYAPLTVKIGRQNIWLGKGLVIGNSGDWATGALPLTVREFSDMTGFDAIRATLDYDPWTVDLIYTKLTESRAVVPGSGLWGQGTDIDMYIANIGYDFTKYDAEAEAYFIMTHDNNTRLTTVNEKSESIYTMGLRGSLVPFENMNMWAEGALQYGRDRGVLQDDKRRASAVDIGVDYTFTDVKWAPKLGVEWLCLSGDKSTTNRQEGWNPLFRGKFDNYIADFRGTKGLGGDTGVSNQQSIAVFGSVAPMTDITLDAKWTALWLDQKIDAVAAPGLGRNASSKKIGWELDGKATYDYTEDVAFSLATGYFRPGTSYDSNNKKPITQIVAGVAVDF
jgi:hypothetical protein